MYPSIQIKSPGPSLHRPLNIMLSTTNLNTWNGGCANHASVVPKFQNKDLVDKKKMENLIIQVGKLRGHIGSPRHLLQSSNQSNDDPPPPIVK